MKEGNSYSNLLNLIKEHGYNKSPISVVVGSITSISPLNINVKNYTLEPDDYIISETFQNCIDGSNGRAKITVDDLVIVFINNNDFYIIDRVVTS